MPQTQAVYCPNCGAIYELTADYIRQYGGQHTQCTSCGNPFPIPHGVATGFHAGPSPMPMPVQPIPMSPYVAQAGYTTGGVWRDGSLIVAVDGSVLPDRCVKCNASSDGKRMRRTMYWHPPLLYVLLISPLIYIIVALCVRKRSTVDLFICPRHRSRRTSFIIGGLLTIPLSIAIFVLVGNDYLPAIFVAAGIVLLIGGLITAVIGARLVAPNRIDKQYVWLTGAGPEFLATLPNAR